MAVLRELVTVLGFDVDKAEAAAADKVFSGLAKGALAVVAAATAAATALGVVIAKTISAGDKAAKTGKRLGISAEEVQEFAFAAERSAVPVEDMNNALKFLQRGAFEARKGNKELSASFARLGVKVTDSNGKIKPTTQLFSEVAEGFTGITDEADRTAIAMQVAGRSGSNLLPLFLEGAKGVEALRQRARDLGFILDNDTAAASERITDNFTDLGLLFTGVGRRIATRFLPMIEKTTDELIAFFVANRDLIDRGIGALVTSITSLVGTLVSLARWLSENRRFILILAGVITAALIPALLGLARAYGMVALSALKAAVVAAAPFLLVIGLAVLIALVIEDVFVFVSGGESAIGNLFDAFTREAQKPGAHWMVKTLAFILTTIKEAIEAVSFFFDEFFKEALELGGITEALKSVFSTAVAFWKGQIKSFAAFMFREVVGALRSLPLADKILPMQFAALQGAGAALGAGGPSVAPAGVSATGNSTQIGVGPRQVQVSVDARSTTDPQAVADATAKKVGQILEDDRRETVRVLGPQVLR